MTVTCRECGGTFITDDEGRDLCEDCEREIVWEYAPELIVDWNEIAFNPVPSALENGKFATWRRRVSSP